jgi:hypothetical protein
MTEVPLPAGCPYPPGFALILWPHCSFGRFLTLISNTILRLCPKNLETNKNPRLSVALDAISRASDGVQNGATRGVAPRARPDAPQPPRP